MDDTISRQTAIDTIERTDWYHIKDGELVHGANSKEDEPLYKAKDIYSVIENLPPAQSELDELDFMQPHNKINVQLEVVKSEIIRCKDCKNWDTTWQNDYAPNYHYCPLVDGTRRDDFYCADAERRTDEQVD